MDNMTETYGDSDIMIFPESIDDINPSKGNYLLSTTKLIFMFIGAIPLFVISIMILSEFGFIPAIAFISFYLIIYIYLIRLYVLEEPKQRESMYQLEDNKYSDYSFFWDITKVGTDKHDDGLLYLKQDGVSLKRAYVIRFDSGSVVGVPDSFLDNYRESLQEFLRSIKMSIKWYSIQKKLSVNESLRNQSKNLSNIENDSLNKLIKIQINNYLRFSMDSEQRYVNYILVINNRFETLSSFRTTLEDVLSRTLKKNSSFKNVAILDKKGIDEFFSTYYLQDIVDTSTIRKTSNTKPFTEYANVVRILDENGQDLPMEILDMINTDFEKYNYGTSVEKEIENSIKQDINKEKIRVRQKEVKRKEIINKRRQNEITFEEYKELLAKLDVDYSEENFIPNRDDFEKKQKQLEKREKQKQERLENKRIKEEAKILAQTPEPKWFEENGEGITEEDVKTIDFEEKPISEIKESNDLNTDIFDYLEKMKDSEQAESSNKQNDLQEHSSSDYQEKQNPDKKDSDDDDDDDIFDILD